MPDSFIALWQQSPNWSKGKPPKDRPLKPHLDYLLVLKEIGKVLMGGPFADESGGLVVFAGDHIREVETMIADDLAVADVVLVASLKTWPRIV